MLLHSRQLGESLELEGARAQARAAAAAAAAAAADEAQHDVECDGWGSNMEPK